MRISSNSPNQNDIPASADHSPTKLPVSASVQAEIDNVIDDGNMHDPDWEHTGLPSSRDEYIACIQAGGALMYAENCLGITFAEHAKIAPGLVEPFEKLAAPHIEAWNLGEVLHLSTQVAHQAEDRWNEAAENFILKKRQTSVASQAGASSRASQLRQAFASQQAATYKPVVPDGTDYFTEGFGLTREQGLMQPLTDSAQADENMQMHEASDPEPVLNAHEENAFDVTGLDDGTINFDNLNLEMKPALQAFLDQMALMRPDEFAALMDMDASEFETRIDNALSSMPSQDASMVGSTSMQSMTSWPTENNVPMSPFGFDSALNGHTHDTSFTANSMAGSDSFAPEIADQSNQFDHFSESAFTSPLPPPLQSAPLDAPEFARMSDIESSGVVGSVPTRLPGLAGGSAGQSSRAVFSAAASTPATQTGSMADTEGRPVKWAGIPLKRQDSFDAALKRTLVNAKDRKVAYSKNTQELTRQVAALQSPEKDWINPEVAKKLYLELTTRKKGEGSLPLLPRAPRKPRAKVSQENRISKPAKPQKVLSKHIDWNKLNTLEAVAGGVADSRRAKKVSLNAIDVVNKKLEEGLKHLNGQHGTRYTIADFQAAYARNIKKPFPGES